MTSLHSFFLYTLQLNTELVKVKLEVDSLEQTLDNIRDNLDRRRKVRRRIEALPILPDGVLSIRGRGLVMFCS